MTLSPAAAGRLAALLLAALPGAAAAATLGLTRIDAAAPVPAPIHVAAPPGDSSQLFVLSRGGTIHRYDRTTGAFDAAPYFSGLPTSGPDRVGTGGERGAYAIAFDRNFATNGQLYLSYQSAGEVHRVVAIDTRAADINAPTSLQPVIEIAHPTDGSSNHYAGWIGVDTENRLLVTTGDSGNLLNADLPPGSLLGKVLRIAPAPDIFASTTDANYSTVSGGTGQPINASGTEVYAQSLRNPYRAGYDAATGALRIADVGQDRFEEVNLGRDGANYGWPAREGPEAFTSPSAPAADVLERRAGGPPPYDDPVFSYRHDTDPIFGRSITGGEVYRGPIAALDGQYFFGDFGSGGIYSLDFVPDALSLDAILPDDSLTVWDIEIDGVATPAGQSPITGLSSFGLDADGGLYVTGLFGARAGVFAVTSAGDFGVVPLPASGWLLLGGIGALALRAQRRKAPTSSRCGDHRNWSTGRTQSSA